MASILSLDFGGTKLSAGVVERGERTWRSLKRVPSGPAVDRAWSLDAMASMASELLAGTPAASVGVSFGGPVDAEQGRVLRSHHVPGWEGFPLREALEDRFGAPAIIDNDANVGALGEARFGAGQGCRSLLYVTISTGIGGGWVLDGHIHRGADGLAGEIGHLTVQPGGPTCSCGRRGCLEAVAAGPAIARSAQARLHERPEGGATLRRLVDGEVKAITARDVSHAARAGDEIARQVLREAAGWLGYALGGAIVLLNPERVVIGGGVSKSGAGYFEDVRAAARQQVLPDMRVDVVPAALGDDAPLWGGVALAEALLI